MCRDSKRALPTSVRCGRKQGAKTAPANHFPRARFSGSINLCLFNNLPAGAAMALACEICGKKPQLRKHHQPRAQCHAAPVESKSSPRQGGHRRASTSIFAFAPRASAPAVSPRPREPGTPAIQRRDPLLNRKPAILALLLVCAFATSCRRQEIAPGPDVWAVVNGQRNHNAPKWKNIIAAAESRSAGALAGRSAFAEAQHSRRTHQQRNPARARQEAESERDRRRSRGQIHRVEEPLHRGRISAQAQRRAG